MRRPYLRRLKLGALLTVIASVIAPITSAQVQTNVRLVDGRLPASQAATYLVQFSGGGDPDALYLGRTLAQIDVLERKPDGSPRVFRAFAPLRGTISSGVIPFFDGSPPSTPPTPGVYPVSSNPSALSFDLVNASGTYTASVAGATNTRTLVGPGNPKGHKGADYLRVTRYFCPFVNSAIPNGPERTCGAMVVYVTSRFDLAGYIVECLFVNSSLEGPVTNYDGDRPENPGHIIYDSLALDTGSTGMSVIHADTYSQAGGVAGNFLASPAGGNARHLSSPGTAPGWMFAVVDPSVPSERVVGMMEGKDGGLAISGYGFHPGSDYGFGPNEFRHDDPDLWPNDSVTQMRARALAQVANLKSAIQNGTASGGMTHPRSGVYQGFGELNPNTTGGSGISGHGLEHPVPEYFGFLRLGSMMATRRANHSFYLWNGSRPLLPADAVATYNDPTPGEQGPINVSLLHTGDVGASTSRSMPSTQFSCISPTGTVIGFRGNGNATNPAANQQGTNGPNSRTWNSLQAGETLAYPEEDVATFVGYSHNLGHSPRFFVAREAYLFGLSMLGYDLALNYAAFAGCHHLAFDVDATQQDWRFSRAVRNLHALGARDVAGMAPGAGRVNARSRNFNGDLGPINAPSGSSNWGQRGLGYHTGRVLAWSMIWQFSGASIGDNSYRNATINIPTGGNNPARLLAGFLLRVQTPVGVTSQSGSNIGTNRCFDDIPGNGGQTNIATRTGGLPAGGSDIEHWTATLAFQDVYFTLAVDAVAKHFPSALEPLFQPARERIFWQLIQNQVNAQPGTGRIGIPYCPPASRGLLGLPSNPFAQQNPVATEADLRNDVTRWVYSNTPNGGSGPTPSGWGQELQNSSLGALVALRGMTPAKRLEFADLLKRQWGLPTSATTQQLLTAMRGGQYSGSITARIAPFLGEAFLYLP
ncbi:MAG: hypothetical protein AAF196_09245 [Planctomycetota bacterium]